MTAPLSAHRRRPPASALVVVTVLAVACSLGAAALRTGRSVPWAAMEVTARRTPGFGLIPPSRREDAVLRSQPELQVLAAGATSLRAKPAGRAASAPRRPPPGAGAITGAAPAARPARRRCGSGRRLPPAEPSSRH